MGFKLTETLGYSPPFQFNQTEERVGFYDGLIDFETLKSVLKQAKPNLLQAFNYETYLNNTPTKIKIEDEETGELREINYVARFPFTITNENGEEKELILYGKLNKKIGNVRTDIVISRIQINGKKRIVKYSFLFIYEGFSNTKNNSDKSDINRVAIEVNAIFYSHYLGANTYLGYNNKQLDEEVYKKFNNAFTLSQNSAFDLAFLINKAPAFVLHRRETERLWKDLYILLQGFVLDSKEKAIIKVIRALAIDESNINAKDQEAKAKFKARVTIFFKMLSLHNKGNSIFKKLYSKMNDYGFGGDNFTALIQELYKFWLLSDYANPDYVRNIKDYKGGPEVLVYDTQKALGFYNSDFDFNFVEKPSRIKIKVVKTDTSFERIKTSRKPRTKTTRTVLGEYELFHPIILADAPKGGELKAPPTNVLPAFYLKAFNDKLKWSNIDKSVWLGVDIVTTFTGVGNLLKLRHLRHLSKLKKVSTLFKIKTAVSILEITTGTLNILLTLADSDSEFAKKLKQYLFWLEIASLGTDVVVERLLRRSAKDVGEALDFVNKTTKSDEFNVVIDHITKISSKSPNIKRVRTFLQKYSKINIKQIPLNEIVKVLKGHTKQADLIADALEKEEIVMLILKDDVFENVLKGLGDSTEAAQQTKAFERGGIMYFRESTKVEEFIGLVVHEGTHGLDYLKTTNLDFKDRILTIGNVHSQEKRAYFYQRQFQLSVGLKLNFEFIYEMVEFIINNYKKI